jgi:hypothetical protein
MGQFFENFWQWFKWKCKRQWFLWKIKQKPEIGTIKASTLYIRRIRCDEGYKAGFWQKLDETLHCPIMLKADGSPARIGEAEAFDPKETVWIIGTA